MQLVTKLTLALIFFCFSQNLRFNFNLFFNFSIRFRTFTAPAALVFYVNNKGDITIDRFFVRFQAEIMHAKMVLLLMNVCQLVLFVQQSTTFSTRTVRFLRVLEMTRQNCMPPFTGYVSQKLKNSSPSAAGIQASDTWMRLGGRFCAPRLAPVN